MRTVTIYPEDLADILAKYAKLVFTYPREKIWNPEGVSLVKRVESEPDLASQVEQALAAENVLTYLVPEDDSAPTRCIDGRMRVGWESNSAMQQQSLGPKVAGGTVHAALAHRIVDTEHMHGNLLLEEDIKTVVQRFKELGIGSGGHIDDNQVDDNTGCGAVDNIAQILDCLQSPETQQQLRGLTQFVLDADYYDNNIVNEVLGRMLYLDALKPTYMPRENDNPTGKFLYKQTVMQTLRESAEQSHEAVPSLSGIHNEVAAVLNFVPGTTFDTDRFSFDHQEKIQVFAWDVWDIYKEADRLYSSARLDSPRARRRAAMNRKKYVTARTLLCLATVMVLTDGSLKLVTITE